MIQHFIDGLIAARCPTMRTHGDGILGHQFNKRLNSFAPYYSQSLLLVDFKENHTPQWFSNPYKKICETRKLDSIHEWHFVQCINEGRKLYKNSSRAGIHGTYISLWVYI
jgi:hypothetical protein